MLTGFPLESQLFPYPEHGLNRAIQSTSGVLAETDKQNFPLSESSNAASLSSLLDAASSSYRRASHQPTSPLTCNPGNAWNMCSAAPYGNKSTRHNSALLDINWSPVLSSTSSILSRHRNSDCSFQNNHTSTASSSLEVNSSLLSRSSSPSVHRSGGLDDLEEQYIRSLFDRQSQLKSQLSRLNNRLLELLHEEWAITGVVPEGYDELRITTGQPTQPLKTTSFPLSRAILQRANTFSRESRTCTTIQRRNTSVEAQFFNQHSPVLASRHRGTFPSMSPRESLSCIRTLPRRSTGDKSVYPTKMRIASPEEDFECTPVCSPTTEHADESTTQENHTSDFHTVTSSSYTGVTCSWKNNLDSPVNPQALPVDDRPTSDIHSVDPPSNPQPDSADEDADIRYAFIELQLRRLEVDHAVISELYNVHKKRAAETKREAYRIAYRTNLQKLKEIESQMEELRGKLGQNNEPSISQGTPRQHRKTWLPLYNKARTWAVGTLPRRGSRTCSPKQSSEQSRESTTLTFNTSTTFKTPSSPTSGSCSSRDTSLRLAPDASSECGTESSRLKRVRRPTLLPLFHFFHPSREPRKSVQQKSNTLPRPSISSIQKHPTDVPQQKTGFLKPTLYESSKVLNLGGDKSHSEVSQYQPSPRVEEYTEFLWPSSMNATPVNRDVNEELGSTKSARGLPVVPGYRDHHLPRGAPFLDHILHPKRKLKRIRSLTSMVEEICLDDSPTGKLSHPQKSPPSKLPQRSSSWSTMNFWLAHAGRRVFIGDYRTRYRTAVSELSSDKSLDPSRLCLARRTDQFSSALHTDSFRTHKHPQNTTTSSHTSSSNWSTSGCSCMSSQTGDSGCDLLHKESNSDLALRSNFSRLPSEDNCLDSTATQTAATLDSRFLQKRRQPVRMRDARGRVPFIEEESGSSYGATIRVKCICSCLSEHGDQPLGSKGCTHTPCAGHNPVRNIEVDDGVSLTENHNLVDADPRATQPNEEFRPRSYDCGETTLTASPGRSSSLSPASSLPRGSHIPPIYVKEKSATIESSCVQGLKRSNFRRSGLKSFSLIKQTVSRLASDRRTSVLLNINRSRKSGIKLFTPSWSKRKSEFVGTLQNFNSGDSSGTSLASSLSLPVEDKVKTTGRFAWTPKLRHSARLSHWPN